MPLQETAVTSSRMMQFLLTVNAAYQSRISAACSTLKYFVRSRLNDKFYFVHVLPVKEFVGHFDKLRFWLNEFKEDTIYGVAQCVSTVSMVIAGLRYTEKSEYPFYLM